MRKPIASTTSKNAATHASSSGNGNPAAAISAAVASIPIRVNLNKALIAKIPAKISRAMRIAAVFIGLLAADERELRALRIAADDDVIAGRDLVRTHVDPAAVGFRGFLGL